MVIMPISLREAVHTAPVNRGNLFKSSEVCKLQVPLSHTLILIHIIVAPLHPAEDSQNPPVPLQQYLPQSSFTLFEVPDYTYSAIGRALIEWNSSIGIPFMVWHMVSTARVYCPGCDLVRSFEGDLDHRKKGSCGVAGLRHTQNKGKGRAIE